MNILKQELKANGKGFVLWSLGLVVLVVAGMMEYDGLTGMDGDGLTQFMSYYPPIMLALFGMTPDVDVATLSGFNWILSYYVVLCGSIYAIMLGSAVVNRELGDRTHEFLFTKPCGRGRILSIKILGGIIPLTLFAFINYLSTTYSIASLNTAETIGEEILLGCLAAYLLSLLFFGLAVVVTAAVREGSGKILYSLFTLFFVMGAVYDVMEEASLLRPLIPLRYFTYQDVLAGALNGGYLVLTLGVTFVSLVGGCLIFRQRDLYAV